MAKVNTRFKNSMVIEIEGVGKKIFNTGIEVLKWAKREKDAWEGILPQMDDASPFDRHFRFDDLIEKINIIIEVSSFYNASLDDNAKIVLADQMLECLKSYCKHPNITAESPQGNRVIELANKEEYSAAWIALTTARKQVFTFSHIRDFISFLNGWDVYKANGLNVDAAVEQQKASLVALRSSWEEKYFEKNEEALENISINKSTQRRFKNIGYNLTARYRKLHSAHEEEMEKMQRTFSNDMKLRSAEKFWSNKRKLNRIRSKSAFTKLCLTGVTGSMVLFLIYWFLIVKIGLPQGWSIGHTLAYVLPSLLYLWLLRIFANEYKGNLDLADDAEEREAMVFTFKALEHEERVGGEERLVILNALFRPHGKGAEENIPLPAWEAMISKMKP